MQISGRNKLQGQVTAVRNGEVASSVEIDIGGKTLTAVITRDSVDELAIKKGDMVTALIKATSVMVMK